jgi:hypothetical protein
MLNKEFFTVCGYIGAALMVTFSFTFNPLFAITGLSFLTAQAFDSKMWNLVILNLISIGGFYSQLI